MELIERSEVLSFLQNQFKIVAENEGHCVFISGEAGIGKTSLVKAFCKQQREDCSIYQGACDALFTPRPLAPLYDIMWQLCSDFARYSHKVEERPVLFSKFFYELSNKTEKILIVFEDIHWADEATLDFIKFFARRIGQLSCLFILTYRDDEIHSRHPLRNVFSDLSPDTFTRIQLMPLSREAVYKLANEKGYDAEDVYNVSGGNPFYVNEILASYSPGVPDNIKDSILSVYERQEEGTKNVWQTLSVIPEGLEINRFAKIKVSWDREMDHCFALKIIVIKNDKIIFKHELYRRTIENSISPFRRIEINKKLLELFLDSFEKEGEIERIVHYAKNANENKLVVKYAPLAAKQAASIGAHIEASRLFLAAIECSDSQDVDQLLEFYEAYVYECYLTNQIKNAIIYQGKALKIRQKKNEIDQIANSLRFLSRLWWFEGNGDKAEKFGRQAIEILESQPGSKAKAMAFSNMAQLKMLAEESIECIEWGTKAIETAKQINDDEVLCHALTNVGAAQWQLQPSKETANQLLLDGLQLALKNLFDEPAARAYVIIITHSIKFKNYELANRFLVEGLSFSEERGLESWTKYILSRKAELLLDTGDWNCAGSITKKLLSDADQPAIVRIGALVILATIKMRKGEPDALQHLEEAKPLAFATKEYQQIVFAMIAFLEYEWLTGKKLIAEDELKMSIGLVQKVENIFLNSEFAYWLQKSRKQAIDLKKLYEPYELARNGKAAKAAGFWEEAGCPFEKAMALSEGNEDDKRNALSIFQQLGADAVYERIKVEMRSSGIKKIPRGLRESTKTNPAQLTNRELDVLELLQQGVQNKEIAVTLFISPKTADHHISNILFKLDVNSRVKAVREAVRLGILK